MKQKCVHIVKGCLRERKTLNRSHKRKVNIGNFFMLGCYMNADNDCVGFDRFIKMKILNLKQ